MTGAARRAPVLLHPRLEQVPCAARELVVRGALAWLAHRGYHVLAIPT